MGSVWLDIGLIFIWFYRLRLHLCPQIHKNKLGHYPPYWSQAWSITHIFFLLTCIYRVLTCTTDASCNFITGKGYGGYQTGFIRSTCSIWASACIDTESQADPLLTCISKRKEEKVRGFCRSWFKRTKPIQKCKHQASSIYDDLTFSSQIIE